eukprot:gb/GECG01016474.1/.p1 GENE.gb/GECG01016474.1/~~gb/GECG01016474.1/.p1  ORF type:complete len:124 (+),score=8.30 gb/GECG01016474.1/:1-372(+)
MQGSNLYSGSRTSVTATSASEKNEKKELSNLFMETFCALVVLKFHEESVNSVIGRFLQETKQWTDVVRNLLSQGVGRDVLKTAPLRVAAECLCETDWLPPPCCYTVPSFSVSYFLPKVCVLDS